VRSQRCIAEGAQTVLPNPWLQHLLFYVLIVGVVTCIIILITDIDAKILPCTSAILGSFDGSRITNV
jgi:hypothetical protein